MNTRGSQSDPGTSTTSTSNSSHNIHSSSGFQNLRTKPTCARCRNHHILIPVKGHKRTCEFRNCTCVKCHVVSEGGRLRAIQLSIWRAVERERKARQGEKEKSQENDRDTSSETASEKSRETTTPSAPGTDSHSVVERDMLNSLQGCDSSLNLFANTAVKTTRHMIPPPHVQHQLPLRYHQYFEKYRPIDNAESIVNPMAHSLSVGNGTVSLPPFGSISGRTEQVAPGDWRNNSYCTVPVQQDHKPLSSSRTQPIVPTAWMTNSSCTLPAPQPVLELSIPCSENYTNSGPLTTAAIGTEICSGKDRCVSLSSGLTNGSTQPIDPGTYINIARSTIQPQRYLQLSPLCRHNVTNYASHSHAAPTRAGFLSTIDGSDSLSPASTSNIPVPNEPTACINNQSFTNSAQNPKPQFSLLCSHKFTQYNPLNFVEAPGTDFRSVDSLSSSFVSNCKRTVPIIPGAWMNVARTTIPPRQPVMRSSQWCCGNLPSNGAAGTSYYDTLIRQYDLNSRYLNGS